MICRNGEVILDEDQHIYTRDGAVVPGVTTIIDKALDVDASWFTEESRIRGTAVHKATALDDLGRLDYDALSPILKPYVDGWRAFKADFGFVAELVEQIVYDSVWKYAGTLDRTGYLEKRDGRRVLIDIKSGVAPWYTALQTAAYEYCVPFHHERCAVMLTEEGGYKKDDYNDHNDINDFYSCITVETLKRRK